MASGKSLKPKKEQPYRIFYNPDGSPVQRASPKEQMSKKERLRRRWEGRDRFGKQGQKQSVKGEQTE
jgi:hypothetical protein